MNKLRNIKCFLLDMDGTIYLEDTLIQGATAFFEVLKKQDKQHVFLTNNSSKSPLVYQQKLEKMGLSFDQSLFFTSGEATLRYIKATYPDATLYLLGTPALHQQFSEAGLKLVTKGTVDIVVLGFDTTLTYDKIWQACDYLDQGATFIATHQDLVCPLKEGKRMPDVGAMIGLFELAVNKTPIVIGKPNPLMLKYVLEKYDLKKEDVAIVGDRLYTDMRQAIEGGVVSILVLSGETKSDDLINQAIKPDYVFENIEALKEAIE